jgi:hypothetical protein
MTNAPTTQTTLTFTDSTRGMRGKVHVRIFEGDERVIDTVGQENPFATAAQARAYAMRWKNGGRLYGGGNRYRVEFADVA